MDDKRKKCWYDDPREVLYFAHVLADEGYFDSGTSVKESLQNLMYYFEKPWKWDAEHQAWTASRFAKNDD